MERLRLSPPTYRRITLFALVLLGVIIVSGGAVRLTGSGLGCTEWPNCDEGRFVAPLEYHAWIEFGNRLFTGLVSIAVILAVLGSFLRVPRRRDLTLLSVGLVVGVLAQIVIGAIVVKTHLVPASVIPHFLVSMALVWNGVVLFVRAGHGAAPPRLAATPGLRVLARLIFAVAWVVLFTGTLVTATGPHSGDPGEIERLSLEIRDIARVHGVTVVTLVALTIGAVVQLYRTDSPTRARNRGLLLLGALLVQASIGYTQYLTGVPVLLVAAHLLGAVLVWVAVVGFVLGLYDREPLASETAPDPTGATAPPVDTLVAG